MPPILSSVRELRPGDAGWPAGFSRVRPRPETIWMQGALPAGPTVAVVGSRKADAYGLELARRLGVELVRAGFAVISGGALGVDGAAHAGALAAGGATVAVLGCGIDVRYPERHHALLDEIAQRGGLLSELPPGTPPLPHQFPKRNRLIAALADAVVVVRAASRSGSLVTAQEAAKLGVPVLAAPGPANDPLSAGTNGLLRRGARLCEGAEDVRSAIEAAKAGSLSLANPLREEPRGPGAFSPDRLASSEGTAPLGRARSLALEGADALVFELLSAVPASGDALGRAAGLSAAEAAAALTRLELSGLAVRAFGNSYHRESGT